MAPRRQRAERQAVEMSGYSRRPELRQFRATFKPPTSQRCVRECLAFAKKFEAKAPVRKISAGKLEEAVAAFSAALEGLTQAAAATIVAR